MDGFLSQTILIIICVIVAFIIVRSACIWLIITQIGYIYRLFDRQQFDSLNLFSSSNWLISVNKNIIKMAEAAVKNSYVGDCIFSPVENDGSELEMCWCEEKCLLGQGKYGRVFKGKWKVNPKADKKIDAAVKQPTGPFHIEYNIEILVKANRHRNILRFYGQVNHLLNR